MGANSIDETLALVAAAQKQSSDDIVKSFSQPANATTGLQGYDLEAPAKTLYPVLTPLRNKIARIVSGYGTQANWRAVTGVNTGSIGLGVSEGNRGGIIAQTTADYLAVYRGMGLENYVTFEADFSAKGFDDLKARAVLNLLQATMIGEELLDYGGNGTVALGTAPTPTGSDVGTGGTLLANTAYKIGVVALTPMAWNRYAGINNGRTGQTGVVDSNTVLYPTITRTNADSSSDTYGGGVSKQSAQVTVTTANDSNNTHSIKASCAAVAGAAAYAWFWGTSGNEVLGAITTSPSVIITAAAASSYAWSTAALGTDNSVNALVYDGMWTQIFKSGSGAYVKNLATPTGGFGLGAKLTSDGAGGITEIDAAFAAFWDQYRLSPQVMYVHSGVLLAMNKLIIANGGAPLIRFASDLSPSTTFEAGTVIGSYLNKITGQRVKVEVHPNAVPGSIMFWSDSIPYPVSNVGNVVQKKLRRDYYQIEWPLRSRKYEYGVYFDGVLQCYFPPAFGAITNIDVS